MEKVALIKATSYEQNEVTTAIEKAVNLLGGIDKFVQKGQTVALKVNLLMKATPEKCMTTHPAVVEAVAKLVLKAGGKPFIVDSAGGPFTEGYINSIYNASGMTLASQNSGAPLNQDYTYYEVENPNAKVGFKFPIVSAIDKADVIFNLTKLKTHSFTGYTNAIKNMFGIIPGLAKVEMHGKYRDLDAFIDFLYDIWTYLNGKVKLNITDAIWGMEGFGPSNGTPKQMNAILASENPLALDYIATQLMTLIPETTPIIRKGIEHGLLEQNPEIEVLGEDLTQMIVKDFKTCEPNNYKPYANYVPQFLQGTVHRVMTKRPVIPKAKCKGCGKCHDHCPAKAITMHPHKNKRFAKIDYNKCIRCYCCQELCPFGAVKIKSGIIYKILHIKKNKNRTTNPHSHHNQGKSETPH